MRASPEPNPQISLIRFRIAANDAAFPEGSLLVERSRSGCGRVDCGRSERDASGSVEGVLDLRFGRGERRNRSALLLKQQE